MLSKTAELDSLGPKSADGTTRLTIISVCSRFRRVDVFFSRRSECLFDDRSFEADFLSTKYSFADLEARRSESETPNTLISMCAKKTDRQAIRDTE